MPTYGGFTKSWVMILLSVALCASAAHSKQVIVGFEASVSESGRAAALARMGLRLVESLPEISAVVAEADESLLLLDIQSLARATAGVGDVEEDVVVNWLKSERVSFQAAPLPDFRLIMDSLPKLAAPAAPVLPALPPGIVKEEIPWGIQRVNAANAWTRTKGQGVKVAILDTGIDYNHPDLRAAYAGCKNFADSSQPCMDDNGHGTHVAGTIAGALDGKGVAGVAPGARLYAVKVLDKEGNGGLVSIIRAILWAGNNGMRVANMSLGASIGTVFMRAAVKYAASQGTTIVAAAGNEGKEVACPACYPDSIAVAASDSYDKLADFSSRGPEVDFIAPGVSVKSSVPGGSYDWYDGTSMATPHVSGLAALAVSLGARDTATVRAKLNAATRPIRGLKPTEQGAGLIDAALIR